jgi:hypothetical protein
MRIGLAYRLALLRPAGRKVTLFIALFDKTHGRSSDSVAYLKSARPKRYGECRRREGEIDYCSEHTRARTCVPTALNNSQSSNSARDYDYDDNQPDVSRTPCKSLLPDMELPEVIKQPVEICEPQNQNDDYYAIEDRLDLSLHRDEPIHKPQQKPDCDDGDDDGGKRHILYSDH